MWALDLGTTNTCLACWDAQGDRPRVVHLPAICRSEVAGDALEAPRLVPSATQVIAEPSRWARLSTWGPLAGRAFFGKLAHVGRVALEGSEASTAPGFVPSFKQALGRSPLSTLASVGGRAYTARDTAWLFLRELFREADEQSGSRPRELTVTAPVDAYEGYRAEVAGALERAGAREVRFLDEPVAAAIGYSLSLASRTVCLVVDVGGGTLDLALVELSRDSVQSGQCRVLAKAGRELGGNVVDRWLLEYFCQQAGYPLSQPQSARERHWQRLMLREACRVKEAVLLAPEATFDLHPPEDLRPFEARLAGESALTSVTAEDLRRLLHSRGLYAALDECTDEVLEQAARLGLGERALDAVLMVGGSTLLPGVFATFEERFGRDRVRSWQPFEAVAYGAAAHAAGRVHQSDFIVHDYALLTHDQKTGEPRHVVVVPRGTRFPTHAALWKRRLVPTCALGEPETHFKLVICEIGEGGAERTFAWDDAGTLYKLGGTRSAATERLVVKLNEADAALGRLDPPHSPSDRSPRLEVSFGVNAERWLCATVVDLLRDKPLMNEEPVVRLL